MYKLLYFLVIGFSAARAQENSIANVPESLLECYNNTYLLDRNNRLPHNIPSLIAIIRKIEEKTEFMDLRSLSVALLHRFRQDGITQNPFVPVQAGVTPYAPNGPQFHRHAETLRLIPGNAVAFPNNSITDVERCSLHAMLSSSIEIMERGDESTTCRTIDPYRYARRFRRRSIGKSGDDVEDVETLTDEQMKTMSSSDDPKDTGADPNWSYPPLPPNHPDSARVYAPLRRSDCPVENGVLKTEWGTVAGGPILAGIAAGLQPQNVKLGFLLKKEWQSSDALSSITLDNKWIATLAGDLAEVILRQAPLAEKQLMIGVGGHWNSSASLPRWYFLNSNENLYFTAAEIRADLDGLILASEIHRWYTQVPSLKLSQIFDMYYSDRGVFNLTIRACNRKTLFTSVAPSATSTEQAYRSALVLSPGLAKVTIDPAAIEKFAVEATKELFKFIPLSMDDPTCGDDGIRNQFNRISTDITIFLDTNWPFSPVHIILTSLLEKLDISKYNSNFTLINAYDGIPMINSSNSILDFYQFNETHYMNFTRGLNLPKTFETIQTMQLRKLEEEKNRGLGGTNSQVVLIVPHASTISDSDRTYCLEVLKRLREDAPDTKIMFLAHGGKDNWLDLVENAITDIFSVGVSPTPDNLTPIDGLVTTIKRVPRRLVNSQCGSTYSRSGSSNSFDDYLEPLGINFYRIHPNYFYTTDETTDSTIKIKASDSMSLTVCTSREILHLNATSALKDCQTSSNTRTIHVSCKDATYIHDCPPLWLSVYVNSSGNGAYQCTDSRFCRYPDMTKFTISYENLVCVNSANSIILSPIIVLAIIVHSYIH